MALVFLGIDPGLSGAVAVVCGDRITVRDIPTVRVKVGKTFKRRVDAAALALLIQSLTSIGVDAALTENVNGWSRPKRNKANSSKRSPSGDDGAGQSASAAFAFGKVAGQIEQALACNGVQFGTVAPARWQRALGLIGPESKSDKKTASRALAAQLFPRAAHLFARVKDDGRAEAALIAHYCREQYGC